jgi:putative transposase
MSLIDWCHLKYLLYGSRRIRGWLIDEGYCVNPKRVQHLIRTMGLEALYRGRNLSKADQAHKVYPYLQHNLIIDRPNQVLPTDITHIPMTKGVVYLDAVIDWYFRRVPSWRLLNTMGTAFCIDSLVEAIERNGAPKIFITIRGVSSPAKTLLGF